MPIRRVAAALFAAFAIHAQPVDFVLALDTSHGTEQVIGLIRTRAFGEQDRAAVVGFQNGAQLWQPLTARMRDVEKAVNRAGVRWGMGRGGVMVNANVTADVGAALATALDELDRRGQSGRLRAIVLLFGSEDRGLSGRAKALETRLRATGTRLYAVAIDRSAGAPRGAIATYPAMTARFVRELAEASGGKLYSRNWDLDKIVESARK